MTKQLTQDVFKNAPSWVKSAAVDGDGVAHYYSRTKDKLKVQSNPDIWGFKTEASGKGYRKIGTGYDTKGWQHSAIDRE